MRGASWGISAAILCWNEATDNWRFSPVPSATVHGDGGGCINLLLDAALPQCQNNYHLTGHVAALVMACYILSEPREASRLLKANYLNQRGDPMIIAEALLYGFPIVSEDGDVAWMRKRAGVEVTTRAKLTAGAIGGVSR